MKRRMKGEPKFHEPWVVTRHAAITKDPFPDGPPEGADPDAVERTRASCQAVAERAEYILWGSRMATPAITKSVLGEPVVMDDRRIIAISRSATIGPLTPKEFAERIATCVNAFAGIHDPRQFMNDLRALLFEYASGEGPDPRQDSRILTIIAQCGADEETDAIGF